MTHTDSIIPSHMILRSFSFLCSICLVRAPIAILDNGLPSSCAAWSAIACLWAASALKCREKEGQEKNMNIHTISKRLMVEWIECFWLVNETIRNMLVMNRSTWGEGKRKAWGGRDLSATMNQQRDDWMWDPKDRDNMEHKNAGEEMRVCCWLVSMMTDGRKRDEMEMEGQEHYMKASRAGSKTTSVSGVRQGWERAAERNMDREILRKAPVWRFGFHLPRNKIRCPKGRKREYGEATKYYHLFSFTVCVLISQNTIIRMHVFSMVFCTNSTTINWREIRTFLTVPVAMIPVMKQHRYWCQASILNTAQNH